jgi:hypothetical protein
MRLDIPTPRTLEEWARSRCREIVRSAAPYLTRCDEPIAFACEACGATMCSRHTRIGLADRIQRNHGGSLRLQVVERGPDLCPACWERDQAAAVAKMLAAPPPPAPAPCRIRAWLARLNPWKPR